MITKYQQFVNESKLLELAKSDILSLEDLVDIILRPYVGQFEDFTPEQKKEIIQKVIDNFKEDYKKGGNARVIKQFIKQTNGEVPIKSFAPLKFTINDPILT
jgi:hypothetical protein